MRNVARHDHLGRLGLSGDRMLRQVARISGIVLQDHCNWLIIVCAFVTNIG